VIVWLNGTHGVGKTTTSPLVQQLIPNSQVFDAEMIGQMECRFDVKLAASS
jgi:broad-specificity NMP kinase